MTDLVEKMKTAMNGLRGDDDVKARILVALVLKEMYAGRSLDLAGGNHTQRWRDTVLSFARREGIEL